MKSSFKRSAELGLVAANLASLKLRKDPGARRRLRQELAERLGLLHGLPQKIGQLLAFSELDESDPAFLRLTENKPVLDGADAAKTIERLLGATPGFQHSAPGSARLNAAFPFVDPYGISASLSQVHRATLADGRDVAIKFQLPGIAEALEYDLKALGWLSAPVGDLRKGFDLQAYQQEVGEMLETELNFTLEAERLSIFGKRLADWPAVAIPSVVSELSHRALLTMTWVTGSPLNAAQHFSEPERRSFCETLVRLFLFSCFQWRSVHADPHPGNYRFQREGGKVRVGLLDFGCVKDLDEGLVLGLRELVENPGSEARVYELHLRMGFNPALLSPLRPKLPALWKILSEPFQSSAPFDVRGWRVRERTAACLGDLRMNYRMAGPPQLLFLLRAFQGLLQHLSILGVPVPWRFALEEASPTPVAATAPMLREAEAPKVLCKDLWVHVTEDGRTRVRLQLDPLAADDLESLVPEDLKENLRARGIRLHEVSDRARLSNYAPGILFQLEDGKKRVEVWLQ